MLRSPISWILALTLLVAGLASVRSQGGSAGQATAVAAIQAPERPDRDPGVVPDEVLVRFERSADADRRTRARAAVRGRLQRRLPVEGLQLLELPRGASERAAAQRLEQEPGVAYAEPNWRRHAMGSVDDSLFPHLWGLHNTGQAVNGTVGTADADVDAPEAWDVTTGDPAVTVAVVDTGIALDHPDLAPAIWSNPGETGSGKETNAVDDDGNGLVDDARGWDYVDDDGDPTDLNGHGTHVAGTIAARGNDGRGVAGVAYGARVMPLRVLDASGSGSVADVIAGYRYAVARGAKIVNASLGSGTASRSERDAIASAPGTLFVVAAGNGGDDGVGDNVDQTGSYPCSYPEANVVCVGATDSSDRLASFSNFGLANVDVAAPGVDILSDWPAALGGSYAWSDGTSMATPHVAGAAALVASRLPEAGTAQLKAALLDGADRVPGLASGIASGRRLNVRGAVTAGAPAPAPPVNSTPAPAPAPQAPARSPDPQPAAPVASQPSPEPAPAPSPDPAPSIPAGPAPDTAAPVVSLSVPARVRAATLRRRGARVVLSCSEACTVTAVLRPAGVRSSRTDVARGSIRLASAGRRALALTAVRMTSRRWARLARAGQRLQVELVVRDNAGNARRVRKTLRVAR